MRHLQSRCCRVGLLFAILLLWTASAPATDLAEDDATRLSRVNLEAALGSLQRPKSVQARFTQTKSARAFKSPQVSTGEVLLRKPDRLRWAYEKPFRTVLVLAGDRASITHPDLKRKQSFDLGADPQMKSLFETILFFQDAHPERVNAKYKVAAFKTFNDAVPGEIKLRLEPKDERAAALLREITVTVDTSRGVLTSLVLSEPDGDETRVVFESVIIDAPIDEALLTP